MDSKESRSLSDEQIYQILGEIVSHFKLLECYECATAVIQWLKESGVNGTLLQLQTKYDNEDFIISDRLEGVGIGESITRNGIHYGVEVRGRVFDNLSKNGMSRENWIKDFHSFSDEFKIDIIEEF